MKNLFLLLSLFFLSQLHLTGCSSQMEKSSGYHSAGAQANSLISHTLHTHIKENAETPETVDIGVVYLNIQEDYFYDVEDGDTNYLKNDSVVCIIIYTPQRGGVPFCGWTLSESPGSYERNFLECSSYSSLLSYMLTFDYSGIDSIDIMQNNSFMYAYPDINSIMQDNHNTTLNISCVEVKSTTADSP